MKHAPTIIITMLALLLLAACGRHRYPPGLAKVDSIAAAHPDSAASMLSQMAADTATWAEDARMYYRLLRLETADRLYETPRSDSAVLPLLRYYEQGGDRRLLPRAYYTAGRVYAEMNDAPQAINCYLEAIAAADTLHERLLMCKAYTHIGYLYSDMRLYRHALNAFRKSYCLRKGFVSPLRMAYVLRDLARAYDDLGLPDSALMYYNEGLQIARRNGIHDMEASINAQMAGLYVNHGKYELAWKHLKPAINYNDTLEHEAVYSIAGHLYKATGHPDSAMTYYRLLSETGSAKAKCYAFMKMAEHLSYEKKYKEATQYYNESNKLRDSIYDDNAAEAVAHIGALYDYSQREKENERLKAENIKANYRLLGLSLIGLAVISALTYVIVKTLLKNKKLNREIKKYEAQRKQQETKPTHQMIVESEIYKHINSLLTKGKNLKEDDWIQLDNLVNKHYHGFHEKLFGCYNMNKTEYRICLLLKIKLRLKDIAKIMNMALSSLSSARSRMFFRSYGKKGSAGDWDNVIDSL